MFCNQCGKKRETGDNFCGLCGVKLRVFSQEELKQGLKSQSTERIERAAGGHHPGKPGQVEAGNTKMANQKDMIEKPLKHGAVNTVEHIEPSIKGDEPPSPPTEEKKSRKPLVVVVALLLLVAISATGWMFMGLQNTRAFNDAMAEGNRFLIEGNLEQAQAHFNRAIEINPREPEPYLRLAEIYMELGDYARAVEILERGMEAVSEEERTNIADALDDIYDETGVDSTLRDREQDDSGDGRDSAEPEPTDPTGPDPCDEYEELEATYRALMAFHEFLSNPQTIPFTSFPTRVGDQGTYPLSWNGNSIRHAALIDLRGDGIPQLLIAPVVNDEIAMTGGEPFMIFEYTGQVEVFHEVFDGGGADTQGWVFHELAFTAEGQTFLVANASQPNRVVRTYFTVEGEALVSVLTTTAYKQWEQINGRMVEVVMAAYVNGETATEAQWEEAPYEVLGVIERRRVIPEWGLLMDIQPLLRDIEERVDQAGVEGFLREEEYTWQERYIQFLMDYTVNGESEDGRHYRLVFFDDEDIPQLLIRHDEGWPNKHRFLSYYQGELMSEILFFERLYYVPYENRFAINPGGGIVDTFAVDAGMLLEGRIHFYNRGMSWASGDDEEEGSYYWSSEEFLTREEYLRIRRDSPELITWRHWVEGRELVEISQEEFANRLEQAIDLSRARGGAFLEFYTLEEIIEQISQLLGTEVPSLRTVLRPPHTYSVV